jgi:hypothetical protein
MLDVPRSTLQAWHLYQDRLDTHSEVVAFVHSIPGLAFLHHLVIVVQVGPKGSNVPGTGHVLPNDEERATKKYVLKYIGPFANAFSAICQCEYSIQVARNHDVGILKTASDGLRD